MKSSLTKSTLKSLLHCKAIKTVALTLIGFAPITTSAAEVFKFSHAQAKLSCTTPSTCGTYSATHPIKVFQDGSQMRLYWNLNAPAGISAGNYIAHTKGASCPLGSSISNMTAQWTLDRSARPTSAIATHCDGFTESHYDISFPVIGGGCDGDSDPVKALPEPTNVYGC